MKRNRYKAIRTTLDGITFASKGQSRRYFQLKMLQLAGEISGLECEPKYPVEINGHHVCTIIPDFRYTENGKLINEDFKSPVTAKDPVYRLKKKLLAAIYGIELRETFAK